jgi:alanine dehydrogenase
MTLLINHQDTTKVGTPSLAVRAIRRLMKLEVDGRTEMPPRLTTGPQNSWLRLMPGFLHPESGPSAMGFKAMNVNGKTGGRYVVFLYDLESGELLSIMDAKHLTRLRTAAVTTIACQALGPPRPVEIGLFGAGNEAQSHLEALKGVYEELQRVFVYSPRRRHTFAKRVSEALELDVIAVDEPQQAASLPAVVLATKSQQPVLEAEWLKPETVVLSIGSTRLDLRELSDTVFARADLLVGDVPEQLIAESGDIAAAVREGFVRTPEVVSLAEFAAGRRQASWPPDDLVVFKSVGTAVQDLAVAEALYQACRQEGLGLELEGFPN